MATKKKRKSRWYIDPVKVAAAESVLRDSKRMLRDPGRLLKALAKGEASHAPRRSDVGAIAGLYEAIRRGDYSRSPIRYHPPTLDRLLLFFRERTDLLTSMEASSYAAAALALSAHRNAWARPLEEWRSPSHNARRQFRSLLRHLIARYEVPDFMDAAWTAGLTVESVRYQKWYRHIGSGQNLRTASDLPTPLTKKQAHLFVHAPGDLEISAAYRWALIVGEGADDRLARSLLATRIGEGFGAEEFRASVVRYFLAHPMLDPVHYGPIIDYIYFHKFIPAVANPRAGQPGEPPRLPAQPHMSLKGREPTALLRAVAAWHRTLGRSKAMPSYWSPSGIPPFVSVEETDEGERRIEMVELMNSVQLEDEGRAMHHCVASYAASCATGRTSIWSVRKRVASGRDARMVTVEVDNQRRKIVQVRGRWNRMPTAEEWYLLTRWHEQGGPAIDARLAR